MSGNFLWLHTISTARRHLMYEMRLCGLELLRNTPSASPEEWLDRIHDPAWL